MNTYRFATTALVSSCLIAGIATTLPAYAGSTEGNLSASRFQMAAVENRAAGKAILSGQYDDAISALKGGRRERFETDNNLCVAYTLNGELDKAGAVCESAIERSQATADGNRAGLRRDVAVALSNRGVLKALRGDVAGAEADFQKALEVKADLPQADRNLRVLQDS